jgi:hypothetical protein
VLEAELVGASESFGVDRSLPSLDLPAIVLKVGFFGLVGEDFLKQLVTSSQVNLLGSSQGVLVVYAIQVVMKRFQAKENIAFPRSNLLNLI